MSGSNLIRNLRKQWPVGPGNRSVCLTMDEAADKIEELESKIKDLKTKLAEYEKQKPVAWQHAITYPDGVKYIGVLSKTPKPQARPLYAAPAPKSA